MPDTAVKKLKELRLSLMVARNDGRISETLYKQFESHWCDGWDFVREDEGEPTVQPEPDCSRTPSMNLENSVIFDTASVPGTEAPEITLEERSSKDSEPEVVAGEQEIDVKAGKAHAFTFCLRCPRVVVALLDSDELPTWLTDTWGWKHGIVSVCCGGCRRPAGFWGLAGKKSSKGTKALARSSSDIAEGMEAVSIDPEKLTGEVGRIAQAIVGIDVNVITFPSGGTKYIDAVEFMEKLTFEDKLYDVNVGKFRAGERRRQELLEPFRGRYV